MLATLPKLADKAFILGFFLPTLLFVLVVAQLFYDQQWAKTLLAVASQKDGWDSLAYFGVAVWGCSVLLMMFNLMQFQFLEGYLWPISKLSFLRRREDERYQRDNDRITQLIARQTLADQFTKDEASELVRLQWELLRKFPPDEGDRLPTSIGNAIRAFEVYSSKVYGADSIPLWLHLSTVIPKDYQSSLDDARAQVNCAVNACFFAFAISIAAAACFIAGFDLKSLSKTYPTFTAMLPLLHSSGFRFLSWAVGAGIVCRAAYLFSLELVYAWGDLVKAAFDCYLPDLAKKMGFELPETAKERQEFWDAVTQQAMYWDPLEPKDWKPPAKQPPPDDPPGLIDQFAKLLTSIIRDK